MQSLHPSMLTMALHQLFPLLAESPQPEPGSDHIVATLVETDIFACATRIADERVSLEALTAYATGDKPSLTPAVINGLLQTPGIFPETVFEVLHGQLICTRATVDELIRNLLRVERDAPSAVELRDACEELEAFFRRQYPGATNPRRMGIRRWSDNPRYETKPPVPVSAIVPRKPGDVLSSVALALQKRHACRFISRLFGCSVVLPAFLQQKPEPDSGTVFCTLFSGSAESQLAAPATAVPVPTTGAFFFLNLAPPSTVPFFIVDSLPLRHKTHAAQPLCPGTFT